MKQKAPASIPTGIVGPEPSIAPDQKKMEGETVDHKAAGYHKTEVVSQTEEHSDDQQNKDKLFLHDKE
jgi:hypothetical protein